MGRILADHAEHFRGGAAFLTDDVHVAIGVADILVDARHIGLAGLVVVGDQDIVALDFGRDGGFLGDVVAGPKIEGEDLVVLVDDVTLGVVGKAGPNGDFRDGLIDEVAFETGVVLQLAVALQVVRPRVNGVEEREAEAAVLALAIEAAKPGLRAISGRIKLMIR